MSFEEKREEKNSRNFHLFKEKKKNFLRGNESAVTKVKNRTNIIVLLLNIYISTFLFVFTVINLIN